uniref:Uncharacterized protein n=1 Tax=Nothobranchius furzeri TaxID=105023 RepID=A0A8C6LGT2_NOTFU
DSAMSARSWASSISFMEHSYPLFQFLELLLATFHGEVLSLIQAVLQVLNCDLQVLLHPLQVRTGVLLLLQLLSHHGSLVRGKGIVPAPDLSIKSALHGVNHPLAVSFDLFHFLILLSNLPVNLTLDLVELKLDTKNLSLLVLQSALYI